jgi:hypothetical protein
LSLQAVVAAETLAVEELGAIVLLPHFQSDHHLLSLLARVAQAAELTKKAAMVIIQY